MCPRIKQKALQLKLTVDTVLKRKVMGKTTKSDSERLSWYLTYQDKLCRVAKGFTSTYEGTRL